MRVAVITALAGLDTASLQDPKVNYRDPGRIDYYAFVDRPQNVSIWHQLPLPDFSVIDNRYRDRRNAKLPKILGSILIPGYDYYIWHDSYCELQVRPEIIIDEFVKDNHIGIFKHPVRSCTYEELDCLYERDYPETLDDFRNFLLQANFPTNQGLFELSSFIYKNTALMQQFLLSWWEIICKYSSRDQISFPYLLKKYQVPYAVLPGSGQSYAGNNKFFPQVRNKFA